MSHSKSISTGHGKTHTWVVTPKAGAHPKQKSIPLMLIVRDVLALADNAREARKIINSGSILVDGIARKKHSYAVGLMDVLSIPDLKKFYVVLPVKKGLDVHELSQKDTNQKLRKVVGKTTIKGKKTQLVCHDGKTLVAEKEKINVGDTILQEIDSNKILKTFEYKTGNTAIIYDGVHSGHVGLIEEIIPGIGQRKSQTKVGDIQTLTSYVFIIGEKKPAISL